MVKQKQLQALSFNRLDDGNAGGSKLVDFDTTSIADGTIASIFSIGALARLVKSPTAALLSSVDGITVIASAVNIGQVWVRLIATTDERFVEDIPAFIDPASGSDDNDGLTSPTALKSADEWCRRMNGQVFRDGSIGTVVVQCAAGSVGNFKSCRLTATQPSGAIKIQFTGTASQSSVGTVSSVVAQDTATNTEYQFTDSSGVGPVISADSRLRIVGSATPANIGGVGYARGFGAGGATNPYATAFVRSDGADTEFFPAAGDTYVVETLLTQVTSASVAVEMNSVTSLRPFWVDMLIGDTSSSQPGIAVTTTDVIASTAQPEFLTCTFQADTLSRINNGNIRFAGCEFKVQIRSPAAASGVLTFATCLFRGGAILTVLTSFIQNNVFEAGFSTGNSLTNAGNILLSRILSGTGFSISGSSSVYASSIGLIWSPPIGTRNGMTTGINMINAGRSFSQAYLSSFNILATSPVVVSGIAANGYMADEGLGTLLTANASTTGILSFLRNILSPPSSNPISGFFRWAASGAYVARGSGGSLSTLTPAGAAAAGHANFASVRFAGGPTNTVDAATANIVTSPSLAAMSIVSSIDGAGVLVEGTLVGIDASNNAVSLRVARMVKRIAGVLTALGASTTSTLAPIGDATLTGVAGIITVSGNTIILQATGVLGATVAWNGTMTLTSTDFTG